MRREVKKVSRGRRRRNRGPRQNKRTERLLAAQESEYNDPERGDVERALAVYAEGSWEPGAWVNDVWVPDSQSGNKPKVGTQAWTRTSRWCDHYRQPVRLLDGVMVHASAWSDAPWNEEPRLGVGFFLDQQWVNGPMVTGGFSKKDYPEWIGSRVSQKEIYFPWQDFGLPHSIPRLEDAITWILETSKTETVEIGCHGGHGRTGTLIAGLLVTQGMSAEDAIKKVRTEYCSLAIETKGQEDLVHRLEYRQNLQVKGEEQGSVDSAYIQEDRPATPLGGGGRPLGTRRLSGETLFYPDGMGGWEKETMSKAELAIEKWERERGKAREAVRAAELSALWRREEERQGV